MKLHKIKWAAAEPQHLRQVVARITWHHSAKVCHRAWAIRVPGSARFVTAATRELAFRRAREMWPLLEDNE